MVLDVVVVWCVAAVVAACTAAAAASRDKVETAPVVAFPSKKTFQKRHSPNSKRFDDVIEQYFFIMMSH